MSLNLGTVLHASAARSPDAVAVRLGARAISYAELDRAARGVAASLRALGIRPGEHVAVMIPNVPEFTIAYFGILYAGCTVVPLNVLLAPPEVAYHLDDSEAKLLFAHRQFEAPAREGAKQAGVPLVWSEGDEDETVTSLAAAEPLETPHATSADDGAVILYTSGTTGKPKGAWLSHANLLMNAAVVVPKLIPIGPDDVTLGTLPLFHSFGQTCIQNATLSVGGTVTLLPRFTPEDAFETLQRDGVTVFAGVPTMYFALLHHPGGEKFDLSKLKYCLAGGAPLPVEVLKTFEKRFAVPILEGYGLSETSPVASFNSLDRPRTPGSIGHPVWGVEMAILDEQGAELADGERGEICIRGHNIMKGYWKRDEATAETMRGGWFHSGDIGIRDADGSYQIVDRVKDMILRGGFNVYPREVEEVLYAHPAIAEAAVIGIEHESHGEEVKAVVALKPDKSVTADELLAWCKERLAAYKYPRHIEFTDALPKGPTGKILKRELK